MRTRCVLLGALLGLALPAVGQIDWVDAKALNSGAWTDDAKFGDYYPHMTHDGQGNWVCVWCASSITSSLRDFEIYVSRSNDDGLTWSDAELLDSYATDPLEEGDDFHPYVFTDGSGSWLTAWYTHDNRGGTTGDDPDLLFSRSFDLGATWAQSNLLNMDAPTDEIPTGYASDSSPTMAVDPNGHWIAVWSRTTVSGGESDLYVAHSTDNGATWTTPTFFTPTMASDDGDDFSPVLKRSSGGVWMLAWTSRSTLGGALGDDNDLFYSMSSDGYVWSTPAPLNNDAATDGEMDQKSTDVGYDESGRWLAAWYEGIYGVIEDDLVYAYSDDGGATWTDPNHITLNDANNPARDRRARIATDGTGRWACVWYGRNSYGWPAGADDDVFYAVSEDRGATWSDPNLLNHFGIQMFDFQYDWHPEVAATTGGRWVAIWYSQYNLDGVGNDWDIMVATACMPTTLGDVQCDGVADLSDVADMQINYAADPTEPEYAVFDLTGDVLIGIQDVDAMTANLTGPLE